MSTTEKIKPDFRKYIKTAKKSNSRKTGFLEILPLQDSENGSVDIPSEEVQSDSSGTVNELAGAFDDMHYPMEYRPQELSSTKNAKSK